MCCLKRHFINCFLALSKTRQKIPGTSISGSGQCHLCTYLTHGIHGNLQTSVHFPSALSSPIWRVPKFGLYRASAPFPTLFPMSLNLFQHRCALLRVQRQECTESSRHGCTKVFYGILISSACPYNGPCFLGFLAAAAREVTRKLSTLLSDCRTSTLQGLVLRRASCKLVTNSLSILYQPLLKFSHLHFLFTFHMPRFPGLPRVPCNSLLKFLIESCKGGGGLCHVFLFMSDILPWLLELYF